MKKGKQVDLLNGFGDQANLLLEMEREVMEMIATDQPLSEILKVVALNFEATVNEALCSILLITDDGLSVRLGAGPSLPDAYNEGIDGEPIGPIAGSCGTAAFRKERVIVSDIANDPLWINYRELALSFGLKASWSTPIINVDGRVLGTFAIYYKIIKAPDENDIGLIDRASNLVKIALDRNYRAVQLRESEEKYRSLTEAIPDYITRYDAKMRHTYMNPAAINVSGFKPEQIIGKTHREIDFEMEQIIFWEENIKSVFDTGKEVHKQFEWKGANGIVYLDWRLSPELDNNGKVKSVLGVARDITSLKIAQDEIKKREKFLAIVTENFPKSFLTVMNRKLEILFIGGEEFSKSNLESDSYIGKTVEELLSPYGGNAVHVAEAAYHKTFQGEAQIFEMSANYQFFQVKTVPLIADDNSINSVLAVTENITERKVAEEKLINSELLFRKLTSSAPVAIFQTDIDGNCNYVNEEWVKFSGIPADNAKGDGWTKAIHPDDRERVWTEWQNAISKKKEFKSELRFIHPNGNIFWLNAKAVVLYDAQKTAYGYIGVASDISERKKVNEIIEESELRYRTTLERLTDGFVALDKKGRFTYMNKSAGEIFGCDPEAKIGKYAGTEFPEEGRRPFLLAYGRAMREQKYVYAEDYYPPYARWYENHIYPSAGGLSIYFRDVTDRKKSEVALKESEEKFRGVVEQSLTGVYIIIDEYFSYVNPQFAKIFGYAHDEMLDNFRAADVVYELDRQLVSDTVYQRLGGKKVSSNYQFRGVKKDGTIINVEVFGTTAIQGGKTVTIGTLLDISERKKIEWDLVESENRLRTILDNEPECVKILNKKGELIDMNPAGLAMIEAEDLQAVKGKSVVDLVNMPYREAFRRLILNVFKGIEGKLEFQITGIKGSVRLLETHAVPLRNSQNNIISLLGVTRDITEQKAANENFIKLQKEKEAVLNRISDKMVSVDADWRYTFLNDAALEEHPLGREKTLGKIIWDIHPEMIGTVFQEKYQEAMLTKKAIEIESYYKPFDIWFAAKVYPSDDGLTIFYQDVSQRKKIQEQLKNYTKKLQDLTVHLQNIREEERAALSRELHDELGQQLTAIKMDLSWLNKRTESRELIEKIEEMMLVTNDAVSTVRRINSDLRPTLLDDLGLFAALEFQANEFEKRYDISCKLKFEMEEPPLEEKSAIAIFRIFQETLTNVAKHAKATQVQATISKTGRQLELAVTDNGQGFNKQDVGKIKSFGLLGMTERAMMMNGNIDVDTIPGKGTTLRLSVPI